MTTRTRAPVSLLRPQIGQQRADRLQAGALWTWRAAAERADRGRIRTSWLACGMRPGLLRRRDHVQNPTAADGFLRHVHACNNVRLPGRRLPFRIGRRSVGWVLPELASRPGRLRRDPAPIRRDTR